MNLPQRKPTRLSAYDYGSPGAYFITICTEDRRCILSKILVGDGVLDVPCVRLLPYGKIVENTLQEIVKTYSWLTLDQYVIMPNHIHLLLRIEYNGPSGTPAPTNTTEGKPVPANTALPKLISTFKRFTNKRCGVELWQRSFHDHVVRGENDYLEIWKSIFSFS